MNRDELEQLLKSAPLPPRKGDYWNDFPGKVTMAISRHHGGAPSRRPADLGLALFGFAAACLAAGIFFVFYLHRPAPAFSGKLADARKYFTEADALFPHQIRGIVFDAQGAHLLLADKPDVPSAPPLFLTLGSANQSESVVTFSGQQIPFNGEKCEVLAQADGHVMLVGQNGIWPNDSDPNHITIAAQPLDGAPSL